MSVRMATNLSLPVDLVAEVDVLAGKRNRSAFVEDAVRRALRRERLRQAIERTAGAWHGKGPAEWSTPDGVVAWVRQARVEETDPGPDPLAVRYLMDSTFVIDYLRGDVAAIGRYRRLFEAGDEPLVNEIVVCEVATGAPSQPDWDLAAFLEPVEFVQPGPDAALVAGRWRAEARANGRHLSLADALIACAADAAGATVLTRNARDFALTPVRIEGY